MTTVAFAYDPGTPGYEPFPRPSHPTPTTALSPPMSLPLPVPQRAQRPQLRIVTEPMPLPPGVRRPVPMRHPALVKTAPLPSYDLSETYPPVYKVQAWQARWYPREFLPRVPSIEISYSSDSPVPAPLPSGPAFIPDLKKGHKRRLSDKFKNLFSALHVKKEDRIPFVQPYPDVFEPECDENRARQAFPARPHRSPGTASFLVSRHLAPHPDLPCSARSSRSSSTAFSMATRPSFAERKKLYRDSRAADLSHFSNPTTLASAVTSSGRSLSSGEVLEKSPGGLQVRLGMDEGVRVSARIRKAASMPDVRVLGREE